MSHLYIETPNKKLKMKSNEELMKNVLNAINWEPLLHAAEIGVIVKDGVVKLTGSVDTYAKKGEAKTAVKNVVGVKKVFENVVVVCKTKDKRTDAEIKLAIEKLFSLHWDIPNEKITVVVTNSWVFLSGDLEWEYQRETTTKAVKNLIGITGVTNHIRIMKTSNDTVKKRKIENAFERNDTINQKDIDVVVLDTVVNLSGHVDTLFQKKVAKIIACNIVGIKEVKNDLKIDLDK
jgi:osmotically-inducible protein OsmY